MVSIAAEVEALIEQRPFLEIALSRGIVNYSNLAEQLRPKLEENPKLKNKEITNSAVMMALRRLGKKMEDEFGELAFLTTQAENMKLFNTMYGLFELTIPRTPEIKQYIKQLYDLVDMTKGDFLTITQGIYEVTIIANTRYKDNILELFAEFDSLNIDRELASISLKIPDHGIDTPGLFYLVTKQLYWDNINIVEIVSTFTEMTFILKELDIPEAMKSLRKITT